MPVCGVNCLIIWTVFLTNGLTLTIIYVIIITQKEVIFLADEKYYRFRVSIPKGAAQIIEWVKNQESPSYAIIHVLREWIAENGTDSVFSKPVVSISKRGRPKASVVQAYEDDQKQQSHGTNETIDSVQVSQPVRSNQAEHKPVRQDVDEDGFVDTDALFARQNRQRQSGVSIADMLNKR